MAKERLTLYDRYGNVIEYDISSASVTIDAEGKSLDIKLSEIATALLQAVTSVTFNGTPYNRENGKINIGDQMQADWNESSASYPTFIKNKPNVVTGVKMGANGAINTPSNGVVTLPEPGSQATFDNAMSSTSENGVQNKVIKAYVDNLINGLINGAPAALDTLNELSSALGNDSNFAATITNALAAKANSSDIYTKSEVDDKVANAGKVKSVSVNGTNYTPNSSGVVNLGTIQGAKGDKGDKGDTVVIDPEGLAQFEIVNDLDTSNPTQGLSARQGKILKQAISVVQANQEAVYNALAGIAFTELPKPALTQIDWTGGTFYVSISKSLTGVNDTNDAVQVAENGSYTNTLSPQSGLTMRSVVVKMGGVDITSTAYTAASGVIYIEHVTGSVVITAMAEQVVTYNVTKKLLNMASSAADDTTDADFGYKHNSVVDGENYTDTIAPVSGAAYNNDLKVYVGGVLLTADTDYTYTNNVLTITAAKVTGDITIIATAATGTLTARSNTSGTTITVGGTTITCDTSDGNEFVGTASGITAFNALSFSDKTKITSLDFGGAKYTGSLFTNNAGLFQSMTALTSLVGLVISGTNTLRQAFSGCSALAILQTIGWDTSNVRTDYTLFQIFLACSSLTKIDLEHFIRSGAGGPMQECFYNCSNLSEIRGLSSWITNGVSSLFGTFDNCRNITELDMRGWNTSAITSMNFNTSGSLLTIKIGREFDTSKVNPSDYIYVTTSLVIEIHSETPPAVNTSNVWFGRVYNWQDNLTIKVPSSALDTYKETEGYSTYQSVITTL